MFAKIKFISISLLILISTISKGQLLNPKTTNASSVAPSSVSAIVHDSIERITSGIYYITADPTGVTDISESIQAVIGSDRIIKFPNGIFRIDTALIVTNTSNLRFEGSANTTIISSANQGGSYPFTMVYGQGNISNLTFENIKFRQATVQVGTTVYPGILHFDGYLQDGPSLVMKNFVMRNCSIVAPATNTRGISAYLTGTGVSIDGFELTNSVIDSVGGMGFEIVSRAYNAPYTEYAQKFYNFKIQNNQIKNTGLIGYGEGVSLSGTCRDIDISHNTFYNNKGACIESDGIKRSKIIGNTMIGPVDNDRYCSGMYMAYEALIPTEDVIISGNSFDLKATNTNGNYSMIMNLNGLYRCNVTGNNGYHGSRVLLTSCKNTSFTSNNIKTVDYIAFEAQNCDSIYVANNLFDNTDAKSGNWGTLYLEGTTQNSSFALNDLRSPNGLTLFTKASGVTNCNIQWLLGGAISRPATVDGLGTGAIWPGSHSIQVTSTNNDYVVTLPYASSSTTGTVITGYNMSGYAFELRVHPSQSTLALLNGVTTNVEASIPAWRAFEVRQVHEYGWVLTTWNSSGVLQTSIVPDAL